MVDNAMFASIDEAIYNFTVPIELYILGTIQYPKLAKGLWIHGLK